MDFPKNYNNRILSGLFSPKTHKSISLKPFKIEISPLISPKNIKLLPNIDFNEEIKNIKTSYQDIHLRNESNQKIYKEDKEKTIIKANKAHFNRNISFLFDPKKRNSIEISRISNEYVINSPKNDYFTKLSLSKHDQSPSFSIENPSNDRTKLTEFLNNLEKIPENLNNFQKFSEKRILSHRKSHENSINSHIKFEKSKKLLEYHLKFQGKRLEVLELSKWTENQIKAICFNKPSSPLKEMLLIYNKSFEALVKQISIENRSHGEFLESIWSQLQDLIEKVLILKTENELSIEKRLLELIEQTHTKYQEKLDKLNEDNRLLMEMNEKNNEKIKNFIIESRYLKKKEKKYDKEFKGLKNHLAELQTDNVNLVKDNVKLAMQNHEIDAQIALDLNERYLQTIRSSLDTILEEKKGLETNKFKKIKEIIEEIDVKALNKEKLLIENQRNLMIEEKNTMIEKDSLKLLNYLQNKQILLEIDDNMKDTFSALPECDENFLEEKAVDTADLIETSSKMVETCLQTEEIGCICKLLYDPEVEKIDKNIQCNLNVFVKNRFKNVGIQCHLASGEEKSVQTTIDDKKNSIIYNQNDIQEESNGKKRDLEKKLSFLKENTALKTRNSNIRELSNKKKYILNEEIKEINEKDTFKKKISLINLNSKEISPKRFAKIKQKTEIKDKNEGFYEEIRKNDEKKIIIETTFKGKNALQKQNTLKENVSEKKIVSNIIKNDHEAKNSPKLPLKVITKKSKTIVKTKENEEYEQVFLTEQAKDNHETNEDTNFDIKKDKKIRENEKKSENNIRENGQNIENEENVLNIEENEENNEDEENIDENEENEEINENNVNNENNENNENKENIEKEENTEENLEKMEDITEDPENLVNIDSDENIENVIDTKNNEINENPQNIAENEENMENNLNEKNQLKNENNKREDMISEENIEKPNNNLENYEQNSQIFDENKKIIKKPSKIRKNSDENIEEFHKNSKYIKKSINDSNTSHKFDEDSLYEHESKQNINESNHDLSFQEGSQIDNTSYQGNPSNFSLESSKQKTKSKKVSFYKKNNEIYKNERIQEKIAFSHKKFQFINFSIYDKIPSKLSNFLPRRNTIEQHNDVEFYKKKENFEENLEKFEKIYELIEDKESLGKKFSKKSRFPMDLSKEIEIPSQNNSLFEETPNINQNKPNFFDNENILTKEENLSTYLPEKRNIIIKRESSIDKSPLIKEKNKRNSFMIEPLSGSNVNIKKPRFSIQNNLEIQKNLVIDDNINQNQTNKCKIDKNSQFQQYKQTLSPRKANDNDSSLLEKIFSNQNISRSQNTPIVSDQETLVYLSNYQEKLSKLPDSSNIFEDISIFHSPDLFQKVYSPLKSLYKTLITPQTALFPITIQSFSLYQSLIKQTIKKILNISKSLIISLQNSNFSMKNLKKPVNSLISHNLSFHLVEQNNGISLKDLEIDYPGFYTENNSPTKAPYDEFMQKDYQKNCKTTIIPCKFQKSIQRNIGMKSKQITAKYQEVVQFLLKKRLPSQIKQNYRYSLAINTIFKQISSIYQEGLRMMKRKEDYFCDFAVFLYDFYMKKFGLKTVAESKILHLLNACLTGPFEKNSKIYIFLRLLSLDPSNPSNSKEFEFFLKSLTLLDETLSNSNIINVNIERISSSWGRINETINTLFNGKISNTRINGFLKEIEKEIGVLDEKDVVIGSDLDRVIEKMLDFYKESSFDMYKLIFNIFGGRENNISIEESVILIRNLKDLRYKDIWEVLKNKKFTDFIEFRKIVTDDFGVLIEDVENILRNEVNFKEFSIDELYNSMENKIVFKKLFKIIEICEGVSSRIAEKTRLIGLKILKNEYITEMIEKMLIPIELMDFSDIFIQNKDILFI